MTKSDDAFRTISEVADELGLATHVLRFWESKFPQIKPLKRAGGRRYYRPDDVALLRRLQSLLHDEGYTIKGVQKLLRDEGARKLINEGIAQAEGTDALTDVDTPALVPAHDPQHQTQQQASLFDAPSPKAQTPTQTAALMDEGDYSGFESDDNRDEHGVEDNETVFIPMPALRDFTLNDGEGENDYDSGLDLADLPEPEPINDPQAPEPLIIVKRALSDEQKAILQGVLDELIDMKAQIDSAA